MLKRSDVLSLSLGIFLIGFFLGTFYGTFVLTFLILSAGVILYFLYRYKWLLFTIIFLCGIFPSQVYFSWHVPIKSVDSDLTYIGSNVVSTPKFLWWSEKVAVEDIKIRANHVSCDKVNSIANITDSDLTSQGISRSITCPYWRTTDNKNFFTDLNAKMASSFDSFTPDASQLLKGVTLGVKPDSDLNKDFQRVGLSHIIVISGFNITLILSIITSLMSARSFRFKLIASSLFIIFFVLIVGPSAPVLRAAIMGLIGFAAINHFKNISYVRILLFAAIVMVFFDPYVIFSVSFQLSMLATLGVILFTSKFSSFLHALPKSIGEILGQTIAASVFTLPYTINVFSTFSPVFVISNLLVLPVISLYSILAYFYMLFPFDILRLPLQILSDYVIDITRYLGGFKNSYLVIDSSTKLLIFLAFALIYLAIVYLFSWDKLKLKLRIEKKENISYYAA